MSHMSRKEILDLRATFALQITKVEYAQGHEQPLMTGFTEVDAELKRTEGQPPSVKLRNYGRLMKHYLEELGNKPGATVRFNVAVGMVEKGMDVQAAIREAKKAVRKAVDQMVEEGYCKPAEHTALRVDKHDKYTRDRITEY